MCKGLYVNLIFGVLVGGALAMSYSHFSTYKKTAEASISQCLILSGAELSRCLDSIGTQANALGRAIKDDAIK